jgi:fluoride ion exporter CrcB/FEX
VLSWLPLGTFLANMIACLVDLAILDVLVQRQSTGAELTVLSSIISGAMGSLSTVSTWAKEVAFRNDLRPSAQCHVHMFRSLLPCHACANALVPTVPVWLTCAQLCF